MSTHFGSTRGETEIKKEQISIRYETAIEEQTDEIDAYLAAKNARSIDRSGDTKDST